MDFNNLQSVWDDDQKDKVDIPRQLDKLKSANMPLEILRRNMKREFVVQAATLVLAGFVPLFMTLTPLIQLAYYLLYVLVLLVSAYFFTKLYFFYKRISNVTTATKDNLYETYFDIQLNIELYKSFTYSLIPFGLIYAILMLMSIRNGEMMKLWQQTKHSQLLVVVAVGLIALFMVLLWAMTEIHTKIFYGKYAKEIKKVIDELKEE